MVKVPLFLAVLVLCGPTSSASQWPAWRGAGGDGICAESNLPVHWTTNQNVRWYVALPERGNSTPIVWSNRVFITQAISALSRRTVICFDRQDGRQLWQNGLVSMEKECNSEANPQCTPSPVTDGQRVIAWFGSAGLFCYDLDGRQLWRRDLGKQTHTAGYASSPVLYKELCLLNFGPGDRSFLVAVNKRTGKTVWRYDFPPFGPHLKREDFGENLKAGQPIKTPKVSEVDGSWATPIVVPVEGHDELVAAVPLHLLGLAPATGKKLWTCDGPNIGAYTSPFFGDGVVAFMGSGFRGTMLAVRPGGRGNVTATHRLWFEYPQNGKVCLATGIISQRHFYQVTSSGFARCRDLATGNGVWEERLVGPGADNGCWSSPLLAGDRLYVANRSADVFILRTGPKFECLATNSIGGERMTASLAAAGGDLFLRTDKHLWCVSDRKD